MFTKEALDAMGAGPAIVAANTAPGMKGDTVALPDDFNMHDLEPYMASRRRARGTMSTSVVEDFAAYVKQHGEFCATVFVNQDHMQAVGVLNLGNSEAPGHADNLATYKAKATAAYADVLRLTHGAPKLTQQAVAEFMEDWSPIVSAFRDGALLELPKAIAAVRNITIENLRKLQNTEEQLSVSRSAFEQVKADSIEPLPTIIRVQTFPYLGFIARTFDMRLGIVTEPKPQIVLRIVNVEKHAEEMANELAALVRQAIGDTLPVLIGQYQPKA